LKERISREQFIRLGAALGVSVAAASVLAACGGDYSSGRSASGSGKGNKSKTKVSGGMAAAGEEIAQASRVPANSAVNFTDSGSPAILIHLQNGRFVAYSAVCTHQGCLVAYQQSTGELGCPCHGSVFDPSKGGAVLYGPAPVPLPQIPIKVQGGKVYRT
jgi:cytochrome b6-f complex iron-sulfur subunit